MTGKNVLRSYVIGFVLSAIFTLVAFFIVYQHALSVKTLYVSVTILAMLQLITQVVYFFHINTKTKEGRWDLWSLIFTIFVTAIVVIGSLWIMYNLNYNMVH